MKKLIVLLILICSALSANLHTTYLWHLQQPNYWPEQSVWDDYRYQKVQESQWQKQNGGNYYSDGLQHPLNDLEQIFDKDDRVAVYQHRAKESLQTLLALTEAGVQVNYSGCLMENVNSLANVGQWGYYSNWQSNFVTARNWTTSGGKPRMDIMGFSMHHVISPLVDENCLRKQIQAHRHIYEQNFGSNPDYSKGFWPAECSFSERIIKILVEEGFEWSIIANSHLARTLNDYPLQFSTNGTNYDPPNPADITPISGNNWWNGQIDGRGGTFAAPFCYQAHKAKYVDPETGQEYKITVVPMCDLLSYMNGFGTMGTGEIDANIAPYDDPDQPSIVLMAHDGDNAWGGGYSYYFESVPNFANAAASQGYSPTTIEQFLADHPVPEDDVIHVEDGSWVNPANDWGHPQFINWLWPMYDANYQFDPNGWTEDARNWAVLTAAQNRVEHAEELTGNLDIADIVYPDANSNLAERAWHHLLPAYTSGYMYYGTSLDMEVKQSLACNIATDLADLVIDANGSIDNIAPTVFIPQRFPYNPGGTGFGPIYGYQQFSNSSDFHIWTFAYDVSGLASIQLKYRIDDDGVNPLSDNANEIYTGGTGVGGWITIPMTARDFPAGNITGNPEIDFFIMPDYIADQYYAEISGITNSLLDYYVEAMDNAGNIKSTPIQHVYVGENNSNPPQGYVSWFPEEPTANDTLRIFYGETGSLYDSSQLLIHLGTNGWQNVNDLEMTLDPAISSWFFDYDLSATTNIVDFVFTDGNGNWDNNNGADWHVSVTGGVQPQLFIMDGEVDSLAEMILTEDDLKLFAGWNGTDFYIAANSAANIGYDVFIILSEQPGNLTDSPWAKAGNVAEWDCFLANETDNNYNGWFDQSATTDNFSDDDILEGYIRISEQWDPDLEEIYIAMGIYETQDGGELISQLPIGNGDLNIDMTEFYLYSFTSGIIPPENISITILNDMIQISWNEVPEALFYNVYASDQPNGLYSNITNSGTFSSQNEQIIWMTEQTGTKRFFYITSESE